MANGGNRDTILRAYAWNLEFARQLTADLSADQWTRHAVEGLENHAAWTLGHLVTGSDLLARLASVRKHVRETYDRVIERGAI